MSSSSLVEASWAENLTRFNLLFVIFHSLSYYGAVFAVFPGDTNKLSPSKKIRTLFWHIFIPFNGVRI